MLTVEPDGHTTRKAVRLSPADARALVKTLADPDRGLVDLQPRRSSVAELAALDRPDELTQDGHAEGAERTTFVVEAYLGDGTQKTTATST